VLNESGIDADATEMALLVFVCRDAACTLAIRGVDRSCADAAWPPARQERYTAVAVVGAQDPAIGGRYRLVT
jgi:hypothetical protein